VEETTRFGDLILDIHMMMNQLVEELSLKHNVPRGVIWSVIMGMAADNKAGDYKK